MNNAKATQLFQELVSRGNDPEKMKDHINSLDKDGQISFFTKVEAELAKRQGPSLDEQVRSGEMTVERDQQDFAEEKARQDAARENMPQAWKDQLESQKPAPGRTANQLDEPEAKFEADTVRPDEPPKPNVGESFVWSAAQTSSAGMAGRVGRLLTDLDKQDVAKAMKDSFDTNPVTHVVGSISGYLLNPARMAIVASSAFKGMAAGGTITSVVGANVMEAMGVQAIESVSEVLDAAYSDENVKETIIREGKMMALAGGAAAGGTAIMSAATQSGRELYKNVGRKMVKSPVKVLAKWRVSKLDPEDPARILVENADVAIKESPEEYVKNVGKVFDDYKAGLRKTVDGSQHAARKELTGVAAEVDALINKHVERLVQAVDEPKEATQALVDLWTEIGLLEDGLSYKFGRSMASVDKLTKGFKLDPASSEDILTGFAEVVENSGSGIFKGGKVDIVGTSKYNSAAKLINEKLGKDGLTHADLRQLTEIARRGYLETAQEGGDNAAKAMFVKLQRAMERTDVWGEDASRIARETIGEYWESAKAFRSIKKGVQNLRQEGKILQRGPLDLESAVKSVEKSTKQIMRGADKLGSSKQYSALMPEDMQKHISRTIRSTQDIVDYSKATNVKNVRKTLEKAYSTGEVTESTEILTKAMAKYFDHDSLVNALDDQMIHLPHLRKALFTRSGKAATDAQKVVFDEMDQYARLLKPNTRKLLDANAKYNRIAGLKHGGSSIKKSLEGMKDFIEAGMLEADDIVATSIWRDLAPHHDYLKNAKVMAALEKLKPSIFKTLDGPRGLDFMEAASAYLGGGTGTALLMIYRSFSNPAAFRLLVETMQQQGVQRVVIDQIVTGARLSGGLAAINLSQSRNEDNLEEEDM